MISSSSDYEPMSKAQPKLLDGSACLLGNAPCSGASPQRLDRLSTLPAFNVWSRKASTHYSPEGSSILLLSAFVCLIALPSDVICTTKMHTERSCTVVPMHLPAEQNFISSAMTEKIHSSSSNPPALILIRGCIQNKEKQGWIVPLLLQREPSVSYLVIKTVSSFSLEGSGCQSCAVLVKDATTWQAIHFSKDRRPCSGQLGNPTQGEPSYTCAGMYHCS